MVRESKPVMTEAMLAMAPVVMRTLNATQKSPIPMSILCVLRDGWLHFLDVLGDLRHF